MRELEMTLEDFSKIVVEICVRDTSADPEHWSAENPMWGHCAVVALLAQDQFGGTLIRQSLKNITGLEYLHSHYSNRLVNDTEVDFTLEQFSGKLPTSLPREERDRDRVLSHPDTQRRYTLLRGRFEAEICER